MLYPLLKRTMDVVGSAIGLILFSPLMFWLSRKIRREMGPPALFTQRRAGRDGKPFLLYKYRTMTNARDDKGDLLPDEARLTALGKWLRSTSLDELPQLWNVLRGDMSLVGPRPLLLDYVPLYNETERRRLDVGERTQWLGAFYGPTVIRHQGRAEHEPAQWSPDVDTTDPHHVGLHYEACEAARCISNGLLESPLLPLDETVSIMRILDEVRRQLGVTYPRE